MKLNFFLLFGLIPASSAISSLTKNDQDHKLITSDTASIPIQNRSLETKHLVISYGDGEGNRNRERQLLEDHLDSRFLRDVTLDYDGPGGGGPGGQCNLCGGDFTCSNYGNSWNNGERTFQDPLNASVDSIKVEVFGFSCSSTPIEVSLNGNVLGVLASLSNECLCAWSCYTSSDTFTINESWCKVGGSNTIKLRPTTTNASLCVDRVELDLEPEPPQDFDCPSGQSEVVVTIDGDMFSRWPNPNPNLLSETSWKIFNAGTSTVVASGGNLDYNGVNTWPLCLLGGDYTFTIYDSYGDGLGYSDGSEFFAVSVDDVEQFKVDGYDFDYETSRTFSVSTNSPPIANCKDVDVSADNACQATVAPSAFDNGSTDNDGDDLTFSVNQSGPYVLETTDVDLTVSDGTATATCSAQITVTDTTNPTVTCKDFDINVSSGDDATLTEENIKNEASDNCGVAVEEIVNAAGGAASFSCDDVGTPRQVTLKVQDTSGNVGTCTSSVTAINALPVVDAGNVNPVLVEASAGITSANGMLSGTASDDDNASLTYVWTTSCPGATLTNSNSLDNAKISIAAGTEPTLCHVTLAVSDVCATVEDSAIVVIVDPSAGFVTGGGWIASPAGAYRADESATGKANFGFVSKYKKGQSIPSGDTAFEFEIVGFQFESTSYEWLVITGSDCAKFKGEGSVAGSSNIHVFMLTACDNGEPGTGDTFRIKIWKKDDGSVVYDNQYGVSEDSYEATTISGGNIKIHQGGNGGGKQKNLRGL